MAQLQPYLISDFPTGISTYLQPWIRAKDALEPLINAYVYRGTINKRAGYSVYGNRLADHNPIMGIMNFIDETTGVISLLVATTVNLYLYNAGGNTFGAVALPASFTGTIKNFFNWTNWQASDGASSFLYMVNNKDAITLYDGAAATQPIFWTDTPHTTQITTALDVQIYKQRLLIIRPILNIGGVQNQSIYWSAIQNPTNMVTDVAGNGGFLAAPTGDTILSTEFIRDVLVVFFTNSTWIFRATGNDSSPFRWDKVNNTKSNNAPYGTVAYDERATSIGGTGLIACDGVNVQRYDISIIDYYETYFSEKYYSQAFSQRYDNLNQSWTLYVSEANNFPLVGNIAPGSDSALVYNFLENTFATYTWSIPLTCLGLFNHQSGASWASLNQSPENEWQNTDIAWFNYGNQASAPLLLAGDTSGNVYYMDDGNAITDNGTSIIPDIVTTRWNPILAAGQKVQFAYIDIYYRIVSQPGGDPIAVTLNFYVDNSEQVAAIRTLTLDGPVQSEFTFKRIFINLIGEFVQMEIDPSVDSFMQFLGFILWAKPSGRLTS
jgi:hypothetical protein